jgi:hypothetical protein
MENTINQTDFFTASFYVYVKYFQFIYLVERKHSLPMAIPDQSKLHLPLSNSFPHHGRARHSVTDYRHREPLYHQYLRISTYVGNFFNS